jgi:hypothetical protein
LDRALSLALGFENCLSSVNAMLRAVSMQAEFIISELGFLGGDRFYASGRVVRGPLELPFVCLELRHDPYRLEDGEMVPDHQSRRPSEPLPKIEVADIEFYGERVREVDEGMSARLVFRGAVNADLFRLGWIIVGRAGASPPRDKPLA